MMSFFQDQNNKTDKNYGSYLKDYEQVGLLTAVHGDDSYGF